VEVPPEYHSKIIGKKGAVISKLRDDFQVNITMPKPEDSNPQLITIKGNVNNKFLHDLSEINVIMINNSIISLASFLRL
jgi:hypothetical protein